MPDPVLRGTDVETPGEGCVFLELEGSFETPDPEKILARLNEIPICFIHGEADDFIKPFNSVDMWKKTKGYAELHLFPGAAHARSLYTDPVKYRKIVTEFVRRIEKQDGVEDPEEAEVAQEPVV